PATRVIAAQHERELAADVTRLLAPLTPGSPIADREMVAEVVVHVAYSMLNFSIRDGQSHPQAVEELKRLVIGYLHATEQEAAARRSDR
ncbi:MAG TPA: hypothetical protein PLO27_07460, partial [Marmoricola sp.]|nr:hypothetical protein [Marmoricola sp.]